MDSLDTLDLSYYLFKFLKIKIELSVSLLNIYIVSKNFSI